MPKMSNIEILQRRDQPTLVIRKTVKVDDLPGVIGYCYEEIEKYLKDIEVYVEDVPFVAYHNMDMQHLDVEIGFPVSQKIPEKGEIKPGVIKACKVIFCMYRGPYSEMTGTYNEMAEWLENSGLKSEGTVYEYYYNGPGFPENEFLTKIVMPLA